LMLGALALWRLAVQRDRRPAGTAIRG
jgi:hypothetical protein